MTLPGVSQEVLQQQFMFAVAVHEDAAQNRRLLGQMQQARQSLLQAARTGACAEYMPSGMLLHCCKHDRYGGGDAWGVGKFPAALGTGAECRCLQPVCQLL